MHPSTEQIVVRPDQRLLKAAWITALFAVCLIGGFSLVSDSQAALPRWAGLAAWAALSVVIIFSLVWILFGAQVASLDKAELKIEQRIGSLTIGRPRTYAKAEIQSMRIEQRTSRYKGSAATRHAIVFQYRGATEGLFTYLSQQRAESLLNGPLREFAHS